MQTASQTSRHYVIEEGRLQRSIHEQLFVRGNEKRINLTQSSSYSLHCRELSSSPPSPPPPPPANPLPLPFNLSLSLSPPETEL